MMWGENILTTKTKSLDSEMKCIQHKNLVLKQ